MFQKARNLFLENEFLSASIFSGASSAVKILTNLIVGKFIAYYLGPEGLALVGQLTNFSLIALVFAGNAISQGVTKYIADYNYNEANTRAKVVATSFTYYLVSSLIVALILLVFAPYISEQVLLTSDLSLIIIILGLSIVFTAANNFFLSIVNGLKQFKRFSILNILSNLSSLALTITLIYFFELKGALASIALNQGLFFFICLFILRRESWLQKKRFVLRVDPDMLQKLGLFAILAFFSTALYPIVSMLSRHIIISEISLKAAGEYEFISRISSSCLMLFSVAISTYYIPKISGVKNLAQLQNVVRTTYKTIFPGLIIFLFTIYICRNIIIVLLTSEEFLTTSDLFLYQLIGDFFRICAQVISFILVARAWIKSAIIIEIVYNALLLALLYIFLHSYDLMGAPYAYAAANIIYFIIFVLYYRLVINKKFYDS